MMDRFDDSLYNRITELVSLLNTTEDGISVEDIAQITETTPEQTREDLQQLHRCGLTLYPEEVVEQFERYDSRYDRIPLILSGDIPGNLLPGCALLFLQPLEYSLFSQKGMGEVKIKDTPSSISMDVTGHVQQIQEAITKQVYVQFRYKRAGASVSETIETAPRLLYFNATDNLYYCISFHEDEIISFRLDRILYRVHVLTKRAAPFNPEDERLARFRYVWGAAFTSDEEPCHVKIRIQAGTANILNKIRSDTAYRPFASLRNEGDYYLYEDDIIGMNAFRAWLMSFGFSVKVLEPASLARELLLSSEHRLQNYEQGCFLTEFDHNQPPANTPT